MTDFVFDKKKIPEINTKNSILTSFDDHFVVYDVDGLEFVDPGDDNIQELEKKIYALIAWYQKISD